MTTAARSRRLTLTAAAALGAALGGVWLFLATPAQALTRTLSGAGALWTVTDDLRTSNGAPAGGSCSYTAGAGAGLQDAVIEAPYANDPVDGAAMVWVGGTQVAGALSTSGRTATFAPSTVAGLTRRLSYEALTSGPILRVLLTVENTTGAPITTPVDYATNFGSDGATEVITTSNGDTTFTANDRWIVTDDPTAYFSTGPDPANTTVIGGPGSPLSPPTSVSRTVFNCTGTQGVRSTYSVTVPAGQQRSLLFFQRIDNTASAAQDAAFGTFSTNLHSAPIFAGLTFAQLDSIVNWGIDVPPVANPDTYGTNEGTTLVVPAATGVLANDVELDGPPPLVVGTVTSSPSHAAAFNINPDGSFSYTPAPGYSGPDSFTYRAFAPGSAARLLSNEATVTINVNGAPAAVNDAYTTAHNTRLVVNDPGVLTNDTDPDGPAPLTTQLVSGPSHASGFILYPDGFVDYTPAPGFSGTDTFTYRARDASGALSDVATATIAVAAPSAAPTAVNDAYATNQDVRLVVDDPGVLANDTDPDGPLPLTTVLVSGPSHASNFTLFFDGFVDYTPAPGFTGTDSFTYRARDASGALSAPATVTITVRPVDSLRPTVSINQASYQPAPTNTSPIRFTAVFSEAVSGFTGTDVSFAGSTAPGILVAAVSGGPTTYTVSVSGMTGPGTVMASIPAGVAVDGGGNTNQASTSTDNLVTFDNVAPTVTINQAAGQPAPTNTSPIRFTAVFSEAVSGFTGSDVSFTGSTSPGTLVAQVSGGPATYTVSVSGMTGQGTVVASIPAGAAVDIASNANQTSTSVDNLVTYDPVAPTVTINQAADQPAPTNTSPIRFTAVFSEAVSGFDGSDVSFVGSTAPGPLVAQVSGGPTTYTVSVSGMTGPGKVVPSIPAGVARDVARNLNQASTSVDNLVTYGAAGPTVTINQASDQPAPTNTSPIRFTAVFSEAVTGFDGADVSFDGSTAPGPLVAQVSGGPTTYTVSVSGMTGPGTVVPSIPAGAVANSLASTSTDNVVTYGTLTFPALVRNSTTWLLRNSLTDGVNTSPAFEFGAKPLVPLTGDWDGNGTKTPGFYKDGRFTLSNSPTGADPFTVSFDTDPRGFALAGDLDGDGKDDPIVYRDGTWKYRRSSNGAAATFTFGSGTWPNTVPVVGDWDGDGVDGYGTYTYATGQWNLINPDKDSPAPFTYWAGPNSYPVVGDWDGDGDDTVAVKLGSTWSLNNANDASGADVIFNYGLASDLPLSWR